MKKSRILVITLSLLSIHLFSFSQKKEDSLLIRDGVVYPGHTGDTIPVSHKDSIRTKLDTLIQNKVDYANKKGDSVAAIKADTLKKPKGKTPRGAAIRSAILPGLGQVYNHKYWKLPLVYGALGATGAVFFYNLKYYRKIRFAYIVLNTRDTANFPNVAPDLQPFIDNNDLASLQLNRNTFRKNIDYSVLFFLFFWGLNVVDATVDAHLAGFNVSDDLSLQIKPLLSPNIAGVGLVLDIHKGKKKLLALNN